MQQQAMIDQARMKVLVCSSDANLIQHVSSAAEISGMAAEVCVDGDSAIGSLTRARADALFVDSKNPQDAARIVGHVRDTLGNKTTVVVACIRANGAACPELRVGSTFTVIWPAPGLALQNALKAAYSIMFRERRRYFRCPASASASLLRNNTRVETHSYDISERGMSVQLTERIPIGTELKFRLLLPGTDRYVEGVAQVRWVNDALRAGLLFTKIDLTGTCDLQQWIGDQFQSLSPAMPKDRVSPATGFAEPRVAGHLPDANPTNHNLHA